MRPAPIAASPQPAGLILRQAQDVSMNQAPTISNTGHCERAPPSGKPCATWCRAERGNLHMGQRNVERLLRRPRLWRGLLTMTLMEVSEGVLHHSRLSVLCRPFDGLLYSSLPGLFAFRICDPGDV